MNKARHFSSPRMGRIEHIHFVGIGGAGMCGIAEVLHNEGYQVTGSDNNDGRSVQHLMALGIRVYKGHSEQQVTGADVVVKSTAIKDDNPEIIAAKKMMIPVIPRAAMLAEIMRFRYGIAIAGTHGKTTTTSLVSSLLAEGGFDPSYVIGGKLNSSGSNAQLGKSEYFVAEADESDASFLFLKPMMAVVTNIDADHMETYQGSFDKLKQTFIEFLHHLPFYGLAVLCIDDPEVLSILPFVQRPIKTYGFSEGAAYRAVDWQQNGLSSEFKVSRPAPHQDLMIKFQWPGRHNVLNALASIAIATELGVSDQAIIDGLAQFQGVGRRFQLLGERKFAHGQALVIDDYGHHPKEISSTIDAFRKVWPENRLIHVFQPHRYSRTKALYPQLVEVLSASDELILMDIYSAGESPIVGIDSASMVKDIQKKQPSAHHVQGNNVEACLDQIVKDGDIILMQGAGSIGQIALHLMEKVQESA